MKQLFRYSDYIGCEFFEESEKLELEIFETVKETKCGFWIEIYKKRKFILKGDGKRFAHETKEMALNSFICRKKRQILINKSMIARAKHSLSIANKML